MENLKRRAEIYGIDLEPKSKLIIEKEENSEIGKIFIAHQTSELLTRILESPWTMLIFGIAVVITNLIFGIRSIMNSEILRSLSHFLVSIILIVHMYIHRRTIMRRGILHYLSTLSLADWLDFLNKFAKKKRHLLGKSEEWLIEYGFLSSAWQFHEEDPEGFHRAVKLAKSKEDFQILMGVR